MLNYTVTSSTTNSLAGVQVDGVTPTVTLTITANEGYTVDSSDFSIGDALPSEIDSVVFTNTSTTTIDCVVTFAASFVMPIGDVSLPIDIDGTARLIDYDTNGTLIINGANLNPNATANPYSKTSAPGDSETILFFVTADAGYHFENEPDLSFSASFKPSDYSVFSKIPTVDGDGNITAYFYNVTYTRSHIGDVTGDEIRIAADAVEIFVPANEYYSYSLPYDFGSQISAGVYSTTPGNKQLLLQIYGDVGAEVTVDITKNGGASTNVVTATPIVNDTGRIKIVIPMPGAVDSDSYEITLSGDIDASFAQPNPITINVASAIVYDIDISPIPGYTITPGGTTSVSGPQGFVLNENLINSEIKAVFKITKDDGADIALQVDPTWANDVSNIDKATNNGTDIIFGKGIQIEGNGSKELYVTATATVTEFGTANVSSLISLSSTINATPVTTDVTASVVSNGTVAISLTGNASDADGDTMTPVIVTQPVNGTVVVDGFGFSYTHTAETSNPDGFTYKVTDGLNESNVSDVSITVSGNNTATLAPSGGAGLYRVYADVGATASTIDVTFDAGTAPARVQLIYSGMIVADTLFVGDDLTDSNRSTAIANLGTSQTLYQFDWVEDFGNGAFYGQDDRWNVSKPTVTASYSGGDIATTGDVRTTQANWNGQSGIQTAAGVDSADGNVVLSYTKPVGGSESILIYVYGITGSSWDITDITVT